MTCGHQDSPPRAAVTRTSLRRHGVVIAGYGPAGREVRSQLRGGVFGVPGGGGVFGFGDYYWACRLACDTAYSACLDTCEGTIFNPKPSSNCTICRQDYTTCLQGCTREIA